MGQSHRKEESTGVASIAKPDEKKPVEEKNPSSEQVEKERNNKSPKEIEVSKTKGNSTRTKDPKEKERKKAQKGEDVIETSEMPQLPPLDKYYSNYCFDDTGNSLRIQTIPKELRMSMAVQTGFRALVVGDLHFRNTQMSQVRKNTSVLRNLIRELDVKTVFLLGDIFNSLGNLDLSDFVFGTLKTFAMDDVKYYYISGNHERWFLNQLASRFAQELTQYNITLIISYLVELKPQTKEHDHFFLAHDGGSALFLRPVEIEPFILKTKALNVPQSDYLLMAHVHRLDDYFKEYRCGSVATFSLFDHYSHGVISYTEKGFGFEFKTLSTEKSKEYSNDVK